MFQSIFFNREWGEHMEVMKGLEMGVWAVFIALFIFIARTWLKTTIEQSVKHETDVLLEKVRQANAISLENYKRSHEVRMKSALLAELMAEWVSIPQDRKKLRQLTNEAFLWLPQDLAQELSKVLSHDPSTIGYRNFMKKVRVHLLGEDDGLEPNDIITFDLTKHEIADIALKELEARTRVTFSEHESGAPMNTGVADEKSSLDKA